jgi:hypothetical protein
MVNSPFGRLALARDGESLTIRDKGLLIVVDHVDSDPDPARPIAAEEAV